MATKNTTKVVTGIVRLSYANVWTPVSINGSKEKYSVSLIIPKSDTKTIKCRIHHTILVGKCLCTTKDDTVHHDERNEQTEGLVDVRNISLHHELKKSHESCNHDNV
jgi:hypothetical protein